MKKDEIRIVQSVLALNRPNMKAKAEFALWETLVNDFARSIKMRNPRFVNSLFVEACYGEGTNGARTPVTIDHSEIRYGPKKKRKA